MYKKISFFVLMLFFAFQSSIFADTVTNIEITNSDKAIMHQIISVSVDTLQANDPDYNQDNPFESLNDKQNNDRQDLYKAKGYDVKQYKRDNSVGYEIKKKFRSAQYIKPDNFPEGIAAANNEQFPIAIRKNPFMASYSINLKFVKNKFYIPGISQPISIDENLELNNQAESYDYGNTNYDTQCKLTIKIPKKAYEHNAKSFDEKTHEYSWDCGEFQSGSNQAILKYKKINYFGMLLVLIMIIVTTVIFNQNKQYSKDKNEDKMQAF